MGPLLYVLAIHLLMRQEGQPYAPFCLPQKGWQRSPMKEHPATQVCIIGAGPAGPTLASAVLPFLRDQLRGELRRLAVEIG